MKFATLLALAATSSAWTYSPPKTSSVGASEAILKSRDGLAKLVVRCDPMGDHTLSIQYKPSDKMGLSMAPVILDWYPTRGEPLGRKLVWEPDRAGAFARDGIDDRNASEVAEALVQETGVIRIIAGNRGGERYDTYYDNGPEHTLVSKVIEQCPWHPAKK